MSKTKTNEIHFPSWQFWIFSFTVSFLVLTVRPLKILAQAETDRAVANKTETTDLEPEILSEINRVRTTPQDYAQWLEAQRQYYDGIWLRLPGEKPVRTNRGRKALEEAIAVLKEQQPLPPLESSPQAAAAATSELKKFANSNNIQYFSYGRKTATGIVMDLVVDELFPDRRRRQSLLSPEAEDTGVVCKPDPRYAKVCAIAYSDSPIDRTDLVDNDVAIAELVSPTAEPANLPTESLAETNSSSNKPVSEPEVEPTTDALAVEQNEPEADTAAVATLPVPPQPRIPPTSAGSDRDESSESETALEEELQIAQAESEIEQKQQELADDESAEVEVEVESEEVVEAVPELDEEELETELDDEEVSDEVESESSIVEAEEVAINTETAGFSEIVEQGVLESGDRVIADDGSLYDFYPLQGKEGDSFTIYLESDDFDAFVALVDSNGKTVGENDDISQEDSNSQIKVTLPADGTYNVIVNTYDEKGTGEYTLKVTR